jgi:hypothetical protein
VVIRAALSLAFYGFVLVLERVVDYLNREPEP